MIFWTIYKMTIQKGLLGRALFSGCQAPSIVRSFYWPGSYFCRRSRRATTQRLLRRPPNLRPSSVPRLRELHRSSSKVVGHGRQSPVLGGSLGTPVEPTQQGPEIKAADRRVLGPDVVLDNYGLLAGPRGRALVI